MMQLFLCVVTRIFIPTLRLNSAFTSFPLLCVSLFTFWTSSVHFLCLLFSQPVHIIAPLPLHIFSPPHLFLCTFSFPFLYTFTFPLLFSAVHFHSLSPAIHFLFLLTFPIPFPFFISSIQNWDVRVPYIPFSLPTVHFHNLLFNTLMFLLSPYLYFHPLFPFTISSIITIYISFSFSIYMFSPSLHFHSAFPLHP